MITRYLFVLLLCTLTKSFFAQQSNPNKMLNLGANYTLNQLRQTIESLYPQVAQSHTSLAHSHTLKSLAATHYTFKQVYKGIPLYEHEIKISVDKDNHIRNISENLALINNPVTLSYGLDLENIKQRMTESYGAYQTEIEAMVYIGKDVDKEELLPIYRLTGFSHGPIYSFEVLLHAQTGEELNWKSLDLHAKPLTAGDTTARGRVFNPNPCTKAQVNYGDLFIDSTDIHKSVFETLMDTVTLQGLCLEADSFRLKGPYVEIIDLEAPAIPPVASIDGDFFYKRDEAGFEQVMAYYHIDQFQRQIRSLGFEKLNSSPVRVDAQGTFSDNSVTSIKDSIPHLLFGLGGVDDAEDADVIIHEYGHALSYFATKQRAARGSVERLGLEEGIGDYLAAIYSKDQGFENWPLLFNWDGHNEFWNGRIANSPAAYPPTDTTIYTLGSIWASTLLELRDKLGAGLVDSLFYEELYMNTPTTSLTEAAQLFILADSLLFEAAHTEEMNFTFCERGLLPRLSGNCAVVSSPPLSPVPAVSIYPNPSQGLITLNLDITDIDYSCSILNSLGQKVYKQSLNPGDTLLNLEHLPSGIYFVQIWIKGKLLTTKKLILDLKK